MIMAGANEDRGDDFIPTDGDTAVVEDQPDEVQQGIAAIEEAARIAEEAENAKVAGKEAKSNGDDLTDEEKEAAAAAGKAEADAKAATDKAAADAKAEADKKKAPEPRLPLSRHKELLTAERARTAEAEARLAEALKAGTREQVAVDTAADEVKITTLEAQYTKQLADGELKEAGETMASIRKLERGVNARQREVEISAATERAVETVRFDSVVTSLEAAYPQIKVGDPKYDQASVDEVLTLRFAFERTGMSPSLALQKAVGYVLKPATAAQEEAVVEEPAIEADADAAAAAEADKGKTAEQRKADAVAKAVAAAAKQPANTSKIGIDSDKAGGGIVDAKAVMKMSQDDFAKLGEAELSRMRGDSL